jgi:hypothetical protein
MLAAAAAAESFKAVSPSRFFSAEACGVFGQMHRKAYVVLEQQSAALLASIVCRCCEVDC